jgi:tetratricopeptide (TPR) repeat protein
MPALCSDDELEAVMAAVADGRDDLVPLDRLLAAYPDEPRLHFLRGSVLAGIGRSIEALAALKQAVALAPDFAIARFQLGFFQLTSGEPADALSSWGPLALLPADHYLRLFVGGLTYLIRDEFVEALAQLRAGIAANVENPPLNRDMQLIVDRVSGLDGGAPSAAPEPAATSATSLLLGQFAASGRPH